VWLGGHLERAGERVAAIREGTTGRAGAAFGGPKVAPQQTQATWRLMITPLVVTADRTDIVRFHRGADGCRPRLGLGAANKEGLAWLH
jgi:hypothetical protein